MRAGMAQDSAVNSMFRELKLTMFYFVTYVVDESHYFSL